MSLGGSDTDAQSSNMVEDLRKKLEEKDNILSSLKVKTKSYIQKLQREHTEALDAEKETVKQLQSKVEAAREFISKQRDQGQALITRNEELEKTMIELNSQLAASQVNLHMRL